MAIHLWWNGDDHAPGETAADAQAWGVRTWGLTPEDAEGDGWERVPDDAKMVEEDDPEGWATGETAATYAEGLAAATK